MHLLTINHYLEITDSAHISFQEGRPCSNKDQVHILKLHVTFHDSSLCHSKTFTFTITSLLASPPNTVTFFSINQEWGWGEEYKPGMEKERKYVWILNKPRSFLVIRNSTKYTCVFPKAILPKLWPVLCGFTFAISLNH